MASIAPDLTIQIEFAFHRKQCNAAGGELFGNRGNMEDILGVFAGCRADRYSVVGNHDFIGANREQVLSLLGWNIFLNPSEWVEYNGIAILQDIP